MWLRVEIPVENAGDMLLIYAVLARSSIEISDPETVPKTLSVKIH